LGAVPGSYEDGGVTLQPDDRDSVFKAFARAFFKKDLDAMYEVVTEDFTYSILVGDEPRVMNTREQVGAFFEERAGTQTNVRFEDVVYHHAPDATFMTYRITGTDVASGEPFERVGIERYTFVDGRIAEKDVYSRPVAAG
jgi:ketosteroid isomerase-like protein